MDRTDVTDRTDVCVRGAGIVGTSLALALARQGLRVVLQSAPLSSAAADVRAYALNRASMSLLDELKVWDALPSDAVTAVHDMHIEGDAHRSTLRFSSWSQGVDALAWIVDAAALQAALDEAVRYAPHVRRSETAVQAPLAALCEGKVSAAREQLGVRFTPRSYGQRAVAARLVSDRPHAGAARQWFRSPDVLALLPFDRPQAERSYALVWSLPEARADEMMALDAAGFEAALADATQGAAGSLKLGSERAAWPLMLAQADPVCGPGWVLLGDCAHVVHPLAGQGLNLGLADVATLARVLHERERWRGVGDEKLLRRYARARELPTFAMAQLTDGLLHLFANKAPAVRELRNRGLGLVNLLPPVKRWLAARALDS
jgi:2-polyprenyl-6-methoxyphenol hydroxylase-like FAD-dependent oxidoreductase